MLGIVRDDTDAAVRAYVRAQGITWTIGLDPDAEAGLAFGVRGQPETFAIARDGTIVAFNYSEASLGDLETMLTAARKFAQTNAARAGELAAELRCPDCEGLSVEASSTSAARAIRRDIRARVDDGQSDEDIRQAYVDRYGESILLKPEGGGLGVVVWGLPVAALILGAIGLAVALRRWRREPRLHATGADEELVTRTRRDTGVT